MAAEKTGFLNFFKKRVHTSEINNITADFFNENLDTINNELETQAHKLFNKKLSNLTDGEHSLASEKVFAIHLHPHTQKKQDELFKRKLGTSKVIQKGDYFYKASTISPPEGNSQGQKLAGLLDAPKDTLP
jgi:hypothetical protein